MSKDFDVGALRFDEMDLSALLSPKEIFGRRTFRIWIKYYNRNLGYMDWVVQPSAEDWLDKADRTINIKQRLAVLENAVHLLPGDAQIWRRLLEEYKSQKRWKKAANMLEKIVGKRPDKGILNELLDVYVAMKSNEGVISVLKRFVKLTPGDIKTRIKLAEALEEGGKAKSAAEEYETVLNVKGISWKVRLSIYKRLGYLYAEMGENKKAISFYLKAEKSDNKDANIYYNLSYLYEKTHKDEKADFYLDKAVRLRSNDVEGRLKLARRLIKRGKSKKAQEYLSDILKENPNSLEAMLLMSQALDKKGEEEKLKKIYEKILLLDPKNETVIYNLGSLEYESGDLKSSLVHFKRYLESHQKDEEIHRVIFDICKKLKDPKEAFKQAQILVKLRPNEADAYQYIFDYLNDKGDYQGIIRVMKKGLEINPDQKDIRKYLVTAYLKAGDEKKAVEKIEEGLKTSPKDIDLLLLLARYQDKQKRIEDALKVYKRIIDISPDCGEAEDAYLRLRLKTVLKKDETTK